MAFSALFFAAFAALAASAHANAAFDPEYYSKKWTDPACVNGKSQSPINIVSSASTPLPPALEVTMQFPTVADPIVKNTGHSMQVEWAQFTPNTKFRMPVLPSRGNAVSDILKNPAAPAFNVKAHPIQFHFHSVSEHTKDNKYYPLEGHIVSLVAKGSAPAEWGCDEFWNTGDASTIKFDKCAMVFGFLCELGSSSPPWFNTFFPSAPTVAGQTAPAPVSSFNLEDLLPPAGSRTYTTYVGSLTTPACNEGLRWHVFDEVCTITAEDMEKLQHWTANTEDVKGSGNILYFRDNHRSTQPVNGRTVYQSGAGSRRLRSLLESF